MMTPVTVKGKAFVDGRYNSNCGIVRVFDIRRAARTAFCSIEAFGVVRRAEIMRNTTQTAKYEMAFFDIGEELYHVRACDRVIEQGDLK